MHSERKCPRVLRGFGCKAAKEAAHTHARIAALLREALLIADHNAYHVGEIVVVRRMLGDWPG